MPKHFRLTHDEFERLPRPSGQRFNGAFFILTVYPLPEGIAGPKTAFVVSKKVAHKAPIRNKIKRWCREIVRNRISEFESNHAYVLSAKKDAAHIVFPDAKHDLGRLFERAGVRGTIQNT